MELAHIPLVQPVCVLFVQLEPTALALGLQGVCVIGTYSTGLGMTGVTACVSCAAGTYSTASASDVCTNCAAGTYFTSVSATAAGTCTSCASQQVWE